MINNTIKDIPFKDDEVLDVQFIPNSYVCQIQFKSGKIIKLEIYSDVGYTTVDYWEDVSINNRNIAIDKLRND